MVRIFVPVTSWWNDTALQITPDQSRHLTQSLRLRKGDALEIVSGETMFSCTIRLLDACRLEIVKHEARPTHALRPWITLVQCLPKQDKLTEILRACTELGVTDFMPAVSERSVPAPHQSDHKRTRWHTVIESASEQSRQPRLPQLHPVRTLSEIVTDPSVSKTELKIVPWEEEQRGSLKSVLNRHSDPDRVILIIGPEGGLSESEITLLKASGFQSVSLGPTILRVEHAGLAAISQIRYHYT